MNSREDSVGGVAIDVGAAFWFCWFVAAEVIWHAMQDAKKEGKKLSADLAQRARDYVEDRGRQIAARAGAKVGNTVGGKTVRLLIKEIVDARKRKR